MISAAMVLNQIMGFLEIANLSGCAGYFMARNSRTIYRKKRWYVLGLALYTAVNGMGICFVKGMLVFPAVMLLAAALGACLYSRQSGALLLDMLWALSIALADSCVNVLSSVWIGYFAWDIYLYGSLAMAVKIPVELAVTKILVLFVQRERAGKIRWFQAAAAAALPVFSLFFFFSLMRIGSVYLDLYGYRLLGINALLLVALNILDFYVLSYMFRAERLKHEMELTRRQNELQYQYYRELEEKYQESRKVIHDVKNHLQVLESLYAEGRQQQASDYEGDFIALLNQMGQKQYCTNRMLNMILNHKLDQAKTAKIHVETQIGDVDWSDLRDLDITVIFANILDNAIREAAKVPEGFLTLKINEVRDFRVVSLRNSVTGHSLTGNRNSRAKSGERQGLGLKNVRGALEAYHGTLQISEEADAYQVNLMFPASSAPKDVSPQSKG